MVKSRRGVTKEDGRSCCANCRFLQYDSQGFIHCGIDGEIPASASVITILICDHWKEARKHGKLRH